METNLKTKINTMFQMLDDLIDSKEYNQIKEYAFNIWKETGKFPHFILAGVGKNWYICEKVEKTFVSMGLKCTALDCTHALHGDLGLITLTDEPKIIIFISKSGTTDELIKLVKICNYLKNENKIKNSLFVSFYLNVEAAKKYNDLYDICLHPDITKYNGMHLSEFDSRNLVPSLSINIMQLTLDSLGVALFEADKELMENYKYNHLAGNNGKMLGGDKIINSVK